MSVSLDGYIADREGSIDWGDPSEEQLEFHLNEVRSLGAYLLGRKLYETMRVWETDPALRETEANAAFADVWAALPKVVFSHTLDRVEGNARLADASLADEIAAALAATDKPVSIGGAMMGRAAIDLGLVDELHILRNPVILGGGTPYLPAVEHRVRFNLIEARTFPPQVVYERYRRASV